MRIAVSVLGLVAVTAALAAQGGEPSDGSTRALVTELRALRADLNRIAGSSIRTQLLVGRLQLQEQRILTLSNQIAGVQKELGELSQARVSTEAQLERMQADTTQNPEVRKAIDEQLPNIGREVAVMKHRERRLQLRESELSAMLADEQARWTDFSSRLDELERALAR